MFEVVPATVQSHNASVVGTVCPLKTTCRSAIRSFAHTCSPRWALLNKVYWCQRAYVGCSLKERRFRERERKKWNWLTMLDGDWGAILLLRLSGAKREVSCLCALKRYQKSWWMVYLRKPPRRVTMKEWERERTTRPLTQTTCAIWITSASLDQIWRY